MRLPCETPVGRALQTLQAYNSGEPRWEAGPTKSMFSEWYNSRLGPRKGRRANWCHRVTEIRVFPSGGNDHGGNYNQLQFTDSLLTVQNGYYNKPMDSLLTACSNQFDTIFVQMGIPMTNATTCLLNLYRWSKIHQNEKCPPWGQQLNIGGTSQ